jgi:hypothetical protein
VPCLVTSKSLWRAATSSASPLGDLLRSWRMTKGFLTQCVVLDSLLNTPADVDVPGKSRSSILRELGPSHTARSKSVRRPYPSASTYAGQIAR